MKKNIKYLGYGGGIVLALFFGIAIFFEGEGASDKPSSLLANIFELPIDGGGACTNPSAEHGTERTFYSSAESENCSNISEVRTCEDGVWNGNSSFSYTECSAYSSCTDPAGGGNLAHNQEKDYYSASESTSCSSIKVTRKCNDGTLEGGNEYRFASCTNLSSCTNPAGGGDISHEGEKTFYKEEESTNCQSEVRVCTNGNLSGSFTKTHCLSLTDTDGDGVADGTDDDDDNDGVIDTNDAFPLDPNESVDTDSDGIGNNADTDDDNDTVLDENDDFPLDATESLDTDGDGTGNNADTDDDNDGVSDAEELANGTDPLDASSVAGKVAKYSLCELWQEDDTAIHWQAQDYVYTTSQTTKESGDIVVEEIEIVDPIKTGKYVCTAPEENTIEEWITGFPETKNGTLDFPQGFPLFNDLECTLTITTDDGTTSSCSFRQKMVNLATVSVNGESKSWNFPVSTKGSKSVSIVYGGNSHEIYPETTVANAVVKYNELVLVTQKKGGETLHWFLSEGDTGVLTDFETGQECTASSPCIGEKVVFTASEKEGTASIILENTDTRESASFTIHIFPSAVEHISLIPFDSATSYIGKSVQLQAKTLLYNGEENTDASTELEWEFSEDGGTTWQTSSDSGVISGGVFIPQKEGLFSFRAKTTNNFAGVGDLNIRFKSEEIISENTITVEVNEKPSWHVLVNGEGGAWHFPVSLSGNTIITQSYGGSAFESHETVSATPTPTATPSSTVSPTPIPTPSSSTTDFLSLLYQSVPENQIELHVHIPEGESIEWFAPESASGVLTDPQSQKSCTIQSPCTGETVLFTGGDTAGVSSVYLSNPETSESITYTIHTLFSSTKNLTLAPQDGSNSFINTPKRFTATALLSNGHEEVVSFQDNVEWAFSYDGGLTWHKNNSDGNISGGVFTPQKEGTVLIQASLTEYEMEAGKTGLQEKKKRVISKEYPLYVDNTQITIEQAYLLGSNIINRNTTKSLVASIVSRQEINALQSLSVGLFVGELTPDAFSAVDNTAFIFKEYHNDTPVKEYLESEQGDRNRGVVEIPVFIPEYNERTYMPDGHYTFVVELYRDDRVVSRYFLPVILGQNFVSCDVNNDGFENVIDLILSLKFLNGSLIPSSEEVQRVDKNKNGGIDLYDIVFLFRCVNK